MIQLKNISKSYQDKMLFKAINCHFPQDEKIALVGNNGEGKSTLLDIITGHTAADEGSIVIPKDTRMGLLDQHLQTAKRTTVLEETMESHKHLSPLLQKLSLLKNKVAENPSLANIQNLADTESEFGQKEGYRLEAKSQTILSGLGFSAQQQAQLAHKLSGGWKMRLAFAKMFINEPNFIVLDEPTNHLDMPSLIWFERFLASYKGTIVLVSHDKEFLNRFTTITLHLSSGKITKYTGNYDAFILEKNIRLTTDVNTKKNLTKKKEQLEHFITRFGAKSSKATQAKSKGKTRDKIQQNIENIDIEGEKRTMSLPRFKVPHAHKTLLEIKAADIGYDKPLLKNISFKVERQQRIAIIGANGIGKSTLLNSLCHNKSLLCGQLSITECTELAVFSQDILSQFDKDLSLLDCIMLNTNAGQSEARSLLGGLLFSNDDVKKPLKVLSGGERNRLGLAYVLAKKPNLLLLDEPTNHLDIISAQVLSKYLNEYTGTLIFVSHNREFINKIATHVLACSKHHKTEVIEGNLEDYQIYCNKVGQKSVLEENILSKTTKPKKDIITDNKQKNKELAKLNKQIQQTEKKLDELTKQQKKLETNLHELIEKKEFLQIKTAQEQINSNKSIILDLEDKLLKLMEEQQNQ